ncbi:hypothetical protein [Flavobacterium sp. W22_SRS_FP1]|uniref:hypothetical protein n=1 Tax=Flavobacterium sp. W22_SRS_FP1 TaxID=3240276 RepID=UPI003F908EB2
MLFSKKINKDRISLSLMEEILGFDEVEQTLSSNSEEILKIEKVGLTIYSDSDEIIATLDKFQIPHKDKTIEEVLKFLFDRLLFEYMEDQSYYTKETYSKFKNTYTYAQLQILIYHTKSLMLWQYNNDIEQIPRNYKILYRKKEVNPVEETNYLEIYERFKMYMEFVTPDRLAKYFNCLVGLKHFSARTKAIYHAFVEELELRGVDYDSILFSKDSMLSYYIDIVSQDNKLIVVRK